MRWEHAEGVYPAKQGLLDAAPHANPKLREALPGMCPRRTAPRLRKLPHIRRPTMASFWNPKKRCTPRGAGLSHPATKMAPDRSLVLTAGPGHASTLAEGDRSEASRPRKASRGRSRKITQWKQIFGIAHVRRSESSTDYILFVMQGSWLFLLGAAFSSFPGGLQDRYNFRALTAWPYWISV